MRKDMLLSASLAEIAKANALRKSHSAAERVLGEDQSGPATCTSPLSLSPELRRPSVNISPLHFHHPPPPAPSSPSSLPSPSRSHSTPNQGTLIQSTLFHGTLFHGTLFHGTPFSGAPTPTQCKLLSQLLFLGLAALLVLCTYISQAAKAGYTAGMPLEGTHAVRPWVPSPRFHVSQKLRKPGIGGTLGLRGQALPGSPEGAPGQAGMVASKGANGKELSSEVEGEVIVDFEHADLKQRRRAMAGSRDRVVVLGDACGYSRRRVQEVLQQPHGWARGERRFLFRGAWRDMNATIWAVDKQRPVVPYNGTVCVLAALHGHAPCADHKCFIPLRVRPHFTDIMVLNQIIEEEPFSFLHGLDFSSVLDAGANVGYTSLILGIQFPSAVVVAVELSPRNFHVLQQNVGHLKNVFAVNAGLYSSATSLTFSHGDAAPREGWKYILHSERERQKGDRRDGVAREEMGDQRKSPPVKRRDEDKEKGAEVIKTVPVELVSQLFNLPGFDFIKMDIEGSEKEVFTGTREGYSPDVWIERAKLLVVETHDHIRPGSRAAVEEAMGRHKKFARTKVGEYETYFDATQLPHPLKHQ